MIAASVGVGKGNDAFRVGKEACAQALLGMPEKKADALLVFGSIFLDQDKLIEGVAAASPGTLMTGCSSGAELSSEAFISEGSVVVMALASDRAGFASGLGSHILWNPRQAGIDCGRAIMKGRAGEGSSLVFLDAVAGNGVATLAGLREATGREVSISGGAAGDDLRFFETYQYSGGKAFMGSISGLGIFGPHLSVGVAMHGFLPIGRAQLVTKTRGTSLVELDGKPASSIYQEYFGAEHFAELHGGSLPTIAASYPLGISSPDRDDVLLRNPIAVEKDGTMTFTAPIPFGTETRLMISDTARGLETVELVAKRVAEGLKGRKPKAVIVVDSMTRKRMIGPRADEEVETIQRILGRDVPIAGYYGYAEIATEGAGETVFHNGSILIWAIAE